MSRCETDRDDDEACVYQVTWILDEGDRTRCEDHLCRAEASLLFERIIRKDPVFCELYGPDVEDVYEREFTRFERAAP